MFISDSQSVVSGPAVPLSPGSLLEVYILVLLHHLGKCWQWDQVYLVFYLTSPLDESTVCSLRTTAFDMYFKKLCLCVRACVREHNVQAW